MPRLEVRSIAFNSQTGERSEMKNITIEAGDEDTLLDVEKALIKEYILPPPPPNAKKDYAWYVVTSSGEELPVSPTARVKDIIDMYQPRELKVLFPAEWGGAEK